MFGKLPAHSFMSLYIVPWHARRYFKDGSRRLRWLARAEVKPELITVSQLKGTAPPGRGETTGALMALCVPLCRSISTELMGRETRFFRLGKGVTHPSCCKCDILWCRVSLSPLIPVVMGLNPYQFRPDQWISLGLWSSLIRLCAHKEKTASFCWYDA